ncbi:MULTISPECIES: ribosome silencing factor [unclassified Adlercreutzia]|uniref:ribosome silencing factor n=1 Tax=unclassified Adlercreutzia TaxID=2636013 RepID=UPI0013EB1F21|nr:MULTISPECIES: ribosome silencing factor [unclassified Adlercreutzia]
MTKKQTNEAPSRECALIAAKAANAKKATDIMVQEVRELIGVTDYFVIATARNDRQVNAIIDEVEEKLRVDGGVKPLHREGTQDGTWALLDYGNIVVHVFQPETREFYRLEDLWNDAPVIDLAAEAGLVDVEYSDRIAKMLDRREPAANVADVADAGKPAADRQAVPAESVAGE